MVDFYPHLPHLWQDRMEMVALLSHWAFDSVVAVVKTFTALGTFVFGGVVAYGLGHAYPPRWLFRPSSCF